MSLPGYDAWLTTDRAAEAADRKYEAWEAYCDEEGIDPDAVDPQVYEDWSSEYEDSY